MNKETSLPPRFRESAFRFYEPFITKIVKEFPNVVRIDPSKVGLQPCTFACRCRDAITSLLNNQWKTSNSLYNKYLSLEGCPVISEQDGFVLAGSREKLKELKKKGNEVKVEDIAHAIDMSKEFTVDFTNERSEQAIIIVGLLAHNRCLNQPLRLKGLLKKEIEYLSFSFDLELTPQSDGSVVMV